MDLSQDESSSASVESEVSDVLMWSGRLKIKSDPDEKILCQVVLERRVEVVSVMRKQNFELKEHKMKNELELQEIEF